MKIEIKRISGEGDTTAQQYWSFRVACGWVDENIKLSVDFYSLSKKVKPQRGFHPEVVYQRINKRASTISLSEVPIPDDVSRELIENIISRIKFQFD